MSLYCKFLKCLTFGSAFVGEEASFVVTNLNNLRCYFHLKLGKSLAPFTGRA